MRVVCNLAQAYLKEMDDRKAQDAKVSMKKRGLLSPEELEKRLLEAQQQLKEQQQAAKKVQKKRKNPAR
jgi:hypothetical protein